MEVVIPGRLAPGNYQVVAAKGLNTSNPMNLTVTPAVFIDSASCSRLTNVLTVTGSGFGEYLAASDSGTSVTMGGETGNIVSWTDTAITNVTVLLNVLLNKNIFSNLSCLFTRRHT